MLSEREGHNDFKVSIISFVIAFVTLRGSRMTRRYRKIGP